MRGKTAVVTGAGAEWNHPERGYAAWIDVPSWTGFFLIQELSSNPDAYFKSMYFQKRPESRGNRLVLGPVWDFDLAFGVADFRGARDPVWMHAMNRFPGQAVRYNPPDRVPNVPHYVERLWTDSAFTMALACRWQDVRRGPLRMEALAARLDGWVGELGDALPRDGMRWNNPEPERYPGEIQDLKVWLGLRLAWIDQNLPGSCAG
jgi:hypothetical protein